MDNEMNENQVSSNNKKILFILLVFLLALLLVYIIFIVNQKFNLFGNGECNSQAIIDDFKTSAGKKLVKIESIVSGVKDSVDGKVYTKVKISITNQQDIDTNMNSYLMQLISSDNSILATCHSEATIDEKKDDILQGMIPANGTISGYIYCQTDLSDIEMLKITYTSGAYFEGDGIWKPEFRNLYIKLTDDLKVNK